MFNHFPSHPLSLFTPISTGFSHFLSGSLFLSAYTSASASSPFFFFFPSLSLNPSRSSLPSIHAAKPISASLLPLIEPIPNPRFSPWCAPAILWVSGWVVTEVGCCGWGVGLWVWWVWWVLLPWPPWLLGFVRRSNLRLPLFLSRWGFSLSSLV